MVIDSSAVVAIVFAEPEAEWFEDAILDDETRLISAASVVEASLVLSRRYPESADDHLNRLLNRLKIEIAPVTIPQAAAARLAFKTFGRGRHKAALNFGDCFSYALAKVSGEGLLCKGNDFERTDLVTISPRP